MIVITGGTGALGKELVRLFKADGKVVASIARHENPEADHNLLHDLSQPQEAIAAAQEIEKIGEPLEAVINAAGMYGPVSLGELTETEVARNMAIHAETPMLLVSGLLEQIKKDGTDIVNVSSIAAVKHSAGAPAYSVSKAALRGFSADLQAALEDYPSRVISFAEQFRCLQPDEPDRCGKADQASAGIAEEHGSSRDYH
jgi:NAD(P)-dependent dehydrogenase (short-subunit alcohol dehydrogenase family)